MTAAPGWETRVKAEEVGFDAHFGKPMDGRDIEAVLDRLHKGEGSGPPTKH
jgi:hypothetical protein